jgi:hypothetical protein
VHAVDVIAVCAAVVVLVVCALILARQRYMLRASGGIPLAVRSTGNRWLYGIARYIGGELRWYRSLGLGTHPTRVFQRSELRIVGHRSPEGEEMRSLPANAVIVDCRAGSAEVVIALSEGAFTGFISWIEASAPAG